MYNKKDIPMLEEKLVSAAVGGEIPQDLMDSITGPGTGLLYDEDSAKLRLADGWIFDDEGNIVERDSVTGPGAR